MKNHFRRILALLLTAAMLLSAVPVAYAVGDKAVQSVDFYPIDPETVAAELPRGQEAEPLALAPEYSDEEIVRVSIVLEKPSTLARGYSANGIAANAGAAVYRAGLMAEQQQVQKRISTQALGGQSLDVAWNLTLAANVISANVPYGTIEAIRQVDGVSDVVLENRYEPQAGETGAELHMTVATGMTGVTEAWAGGYTGAGTRIAIVDTGTDTDHQSFGEAAFLYALEQNAQAAQLSTEDYLESLDLLDVEELEQLLPQLNIYKGYTKQNGAIQMDDTLTAEDLYISAKLPFGFNYIDNSLDVTHDNDAASEHGSHVAGIAAANRYIQTGEDTFADAASTVRMVGVAPDAQILTMKVFGKNGGAYDSDYLVAIEDALLLGCDSINLSLGSAAAGFSYAGSELANSVLGAILDSDAVVTISAGNNADWGGNTVYAGSTYLAQNGAGYLYGDDVSFATGGSPGTYAPALTVASVDNNGLTGSYLGVEGLQPVVYNEGSGGKNLALETLDTAEDGQGTTLEFIYLDGNLGAGEDGTSTLPEGVDYTGKVVFVSRGVSSFYQKANVCAAAGAAATVVYNNTAGTISMNLTGYQYTAPCVSIRQADAQAIRDSAEPVYPEDGTEGDAPLYYTGQLKICRGAVGTEVFDGTDYTMSSFSSWGATGALTIKPEIVAPGGNIYSVDGSVAGGTAYEIMSGTSMAAPHMAGVAALVAQYIRETGLTEKAEYGTGQLAQSLIMGTASPLTEQESGLPYSVLRQGAGLANVGNAIAAESYLAVEGQTGGKVKAEFGDDPERTGEYRFAFTVNSLTDRDMEYTLDAETLTQDIFDWYADENGNVTSYLDTWTAELEAAVSYTADGKDIIPADLSGYDFDGDGRITANDAQWLLDYRTGSIESIFHEENRDVNGDGEFTTADARTLLAAVNDASFTVPAGDSVRVEVTIRLPEQVKARLDETYVNGAYVEGYVYLKPVADGEGLTGVEQSIPFLGFYGSWSDGSMYDHNEFVDVFYDNTLGSNYLTDRTNFFTYQFAGSSSRYYFVGNPYGLDEEYLEARNSFNNAGNVFCDVTYTLIRNAAALRLEIRDKQTGELYLEQETGAQYAAYYHSDTGSFRNAAYNLPIGWTGTDAQGQPLAEGTEVVIDLMAAPEYNRSPEGTIDWDALGAGCHLTTTAVMDATAPEILEIAYSLVGGKTLYISARDNRYIAAALLINADGTKLHLNQTVNQTEEGQTQQILMDVSQVVGRNVIVCIADYAGNESYYAVDLGSSPREDNGIFHAYNAGQKAWVSFDPDVSGNETAMAQTDLSIQAAEDAGGCVVAMDAAYNLYAIPEGCFNDPVFITNAGLDFWDMAYNPVNGKLYGIVRGSSTSSLYEIDPLAETCTLVTANVGARLITLACDDEGNFYGVQNRATNVTAKLYRFTLDSTAEAVGELAVGDTLYDTANTNSKRQSMDWDSETDTLYWAGSDNILYSVDVTTAAMTPVGTLSGQTLGLFTANTSQGHWYDPVDTATSLTLNRTSLTLLPDNTAFLTVTVKPWNAADKTVTWSSSDETVATVSADGLVTAVGLGEATITVQSNLTPSLTAQCQVSVKKLDFTIQGILQDEEGIAQLYTWNVAEDTWTAGPVLTLGSDLSAAAYDYEKDELWVVDSAACEYQVDPATGENLTTFQTKFAGPCSSLTDMAYASVYDKFMGTNGKWLIQNFDMQKATTVLGGMILAPWLTNMTGASEILGLATAMEQTNDSGITGQMLFYVDDLGYLWNVFNYQTNRWVSTTPYKVLDVSDVDYQSANSSMFYDLETGFIFLAAYDALTGSNDLYAFQITETEVLTFKLGNFGQDVWPVSIYNVEGAGMGTESARDLTFGQENWQALPDTAEVSFGGLNTAHPNSLVGDEKDLGDSSASQVILSSDRETVNGLLKITYDPETVTLTDAAGATELYSICASEGTVLFGYASIQTLAADAALGSLTFQWNAGAGNETEIRVETLEENDAGNTGTQVLTISRVCNHDNLEIRDAKEATCFEEGYTGDTYCTDCGALVETGRPIPISCPSRAYEDLDITKWYHEYTDYVIENGLMVGCGTSFQPNAAATRAMLVQTLYNLAGKPAAGTDSGFRDVSSDAWYAEAVTWARENGIVFGVDETHFVPSRPVTREEAVTILYRYVRDYCKAGMAEGTALTDFRDGDQVAAYARPAMEWAVAVGLVEGVGAGRIAPKDDTLRCQLAKLLTILDRDILK